MLNKRGKPLSRKQLRDRRRGVAIRQHVFDDSILHLYFVGHDTYCPVHFPPLPGTEQAINAERAQSANPKE
jgi:hypothetical protein